jgi:3-methyl-2-oxobutanoate hydroxymethyltransferase
MSDISIKRLSTREIRRRKGQAPLVCLTAYTAPMAKILDPYVDLLLVGDSLGMVVYGFADTLPVSLEMMIRHGAAVVRGSRRACVIVDMPFGSYQESAQAAFRSASRLLAETGCEGVKLEGGEEMAETIAFLCQRGIPVMAHIGLQPQSVHALGGYRTQGREPEAADKLRRDARAVADAGAFSIVIESTVEWLAREITRNVPIPTIGIGASPHCDGQILVVDDLLGMYPDFTPRFVKRYAELGQAVRAAAEAYAEDVRARRFPGPEHCFGAPAPAPSRKKVTG